MCLIKTAYRGWVQLGEGKTCSNSNQLEGVFRGVPLEVAREQNAARGLRFIHALDDDQYGPKFRGREFSDVMPIVGAFGEPL